MLISESKQRKISCQLFFCFSVALKGLVYKLAVEQQIRYTKRVDLPTEVAVQVVFSSRWRCVSVVTQRKVWTPLFKKSSKISF